MNKITIGWRKYKKVPVELPDACYETFESLSEIFSQVAIFGGCIRDHHIGRVAFRDIDTHVVPHSQDDIPSPLIDALRKIPKREWRQPDSSIKDIFKEWTGTDLKAFLRQDTSYKFDCMNSAGTKIDLSVLRQFDETAHPNVPFALSPILKASSPFSSVGFDKTGMWAAADFLKETETMLFSIYRDRGLRPVVWDIPYFERIRETYPELKLTNIEAHVYKKVRKMLDDIRSFQDPEHRISQP